ncbi:Non-specific lipid-transfer protein 2 [Morella rubra]|uniref:Non-specific lipid-transfer protein 2 n=1 Tax=Morella rubra TaxID=262757 RepID=A0A6A1V319_9ROSI|nr:Non-specific lipid-transfer protein 2 [Morella rubra]
MAQQAKVLAFFVLLMASESAMGSITCSSMIRDLNPCLPYLREVNDVPSAGCCNAARVVGSYFNSNTDRYAACECLQDTGATVNGIYVSRMRSLPQRCAVSINLPPISADGRLDCSW